MPVSQEIWPPRKFGLPGPNFLGNLARGGPYFLGNLARGGPYFLVNMAPRSEIWPP